MSLFSLGSNQEMRLFSNLRRPPSMLLLLLVTISLLLSALQAAPSPKASNIADAAQLPRPSPLAAAAAEKDAPTTANSSSHSTVAQTVPKNDKLESNAVVKQPPVAEDTRQASMPSTTAAAKISDSNTDTASKKQKPAEKSERVGSEAKNDERPVPESKNTAEDDYTDPVNVKAPQIGGNGRGGATGAFAFLFLLFIVIFVLVHYRKKILGLLVEGRISRRMGTGRGGSGPSSNVRYRRLSSNERAGDVDDKDYVS